jgi:hypothetical protein
VLSEKSNRSTSSSGLVFLSVLLAMFLSLPLPALAAHRPKHVRDLENPSLVIVDEPAGVVTDVADAEEAEVEEALEDPGDEDRSDRTEPADQDLGKPKADRKDARPKHDKERTDKNKHSEDAILVDPDPKNPCPNDGCHEPTTNGQEASVGLVPDTAGGAEVVVAPGGPGAKDSEEERASFGHLLSAGEGKHNSASGARFLFDGATIVGASQPSLAILVNALNDADGDGIYSDSETTPEAGADVNFKAIITNMGSTAFEIAAVSHSFKQEIDRVQVEVCADLDGLTLGFGESLTCSFSVESYSPPMGQSAVNTVTASVIEAAGSGSRGTSDSDNTTVSTFLEDQVLAVAIERAPGSLAFTGTDAARLLVVGLLLLAAGGASLSLSRVRAGRPERPVVWVGPRFKASRPTTGGSAELAPTEKAARR